MQVKDWVGKLVKTQGKKQAEKVIDDMCKIFKNGNTAHHFFDEADWSITHNGQYKYSQLQKFTLGRMEKRINKNKTFYQQARSILKNGKY